MSRVGRFGRIGLWLLILGLAVSAVTRWLRDPLDGWMTVVILIATVLAIAVAFVVYTWMFGRLMDRRGHALSAEVDGRLWTTVLEVGAEIEQFAVPGASIKELRGWRMPNFLIVRDSTLEIWSSRRASTQLATIPLDCVRGASVGSLAVSHRTVSAAVLTLTQGQEVALGLCRPSGLARSALAAQTLVSEFDALVKTGD